MLLDVRIRPWYNPGVRSAVYVVPGIVGVLLFMTMVMITSMAVVRPGWCSMCSGAVSPRCMG